MNITPTVDERITAIVFDATGGNGPMPEYAVTTLERRWSDGLDFHEVAVWTIKEIAERAWWDGYNAAFGAERHDSDDHTDDRTKLDCRICTTS